MGLKHQGKVDRKLSRAEAESLFDTYTEMSAQIDEGKVGSLAIQGRPTVPDDFGGYNRLIENAPDIYAKRSPETLAADVGSPNAAYMPHQLLPFEDGAVVEHELETILGAAEWAKFRRRLYGQLGYKSRPAFNSLDFQRSMSGTLKEKIELGMPFVRDPVTAWEQVVFHNNIALETGKMFGWSKPEQKRILQSMGRLVGVENAVLKSGARALNVATPIGEEPLAIRLKNHHAATLFENMANMAMQRPWEEEASRKVAGFLTSSNIVTKLTMAVFANMTQPVQTGVFGGMRNMLKGIRDLTKQEGRQTVGRGLSAVDGVLYDTPAHWLQERSFKSGGLGAYFANMMQNASDVTLSATQFKRVEAWERKLGGATAINRAIEIVTQSAGMTSNGIRLKGKQLELARRHARSMGFDLDEVVRKVRRAGVFDSPGQPAYKWFNSEEGVDWFMNTIFRGTQATQFMNTPMRRPLWWGTPSGRVIFQFKTFAFQQYRFIRDQVLAEVARGNPRPLAVYLGIAPIAGEFVGTMKNLIKEGDFDRGRNSITKHLGNMMYVGGAGILGDLWQAAQFEQLAEGALGPSFSDVVSWSEHLARRDMSGFTRDFNRLPMMRVQRSFTNHMLPKVGSITTEYIDQMIETYGSRESGPEGRTTSSAISSAELIRRSRRDR